MRKIIYAAAFAAIIFSLGTFQASAQKTLKIGKTEIVLQTPLKIYDTKEVPAIDSVPVTVKTVQGKKSSSSPKPYKHYSKHFEDIYFGMGLFTNGAFGGEKYMPQVQYGKAFDLQTGFKIFYRPVRWFSVGTQIQYSFYSYRIDGAAQTGFIDKPVYGNITSEYFKSDNVGTAILLRFGLFRKVSLELGAYGDYSFSKRYVVNTTEGKQKYRDCTRFTPLQAGVQASLNLHWFCIYTKYRITNMFNHELLPLEPPRWSVGAMLQF